jgi:GT2 family glycosyltransferase
MTNPRESLDLLKRPVVRIMRIAAKAIRIGRQDGIRGLSRWTWRKVLSRLRGKQPGTLTVDQYRAWIAANEPGETELRSQRSFAHAFPYQPLISFITPVYNPSPGVLRDTLESVLAQTYSNWEMCIVDGGSRDDISQTLAEFAGRDACIRVQRLARNLGISGNTNEARKMARGEFIALLDHDDIIAPNMLFEVVAVLNRKPRTDICYFDDDLLSDDGRTRHSPFFKPGWSPDMLLSANYLTHAVIRREFADEVGPFDSACDGAQDWDFMFRCTARTDRIERIPKVLYHWRQIAGSCAGSLEQKPYAAQAQVRAIQKHLAGVGISGVTIGRVETGMLRTTWPTQQKKVSIIIPTKDKVRFLRRCLKSIFKLTTYSNYEILIVDTGSTEKKTLAYYDKLRGDSRIRFIKYTGKFNYSKANNLAARQADGDFLLFLNNDTEALVPDWLEEMVRWAERPGVGVVGARLLYAGGTIQHAGVVLGLRGPAGHIFLGAEPYHHGMFGSAEWYRNYLAVTGACAMMPRSVFEQIGGFAERYELAFSDIELCLRAREKGYRIVCTPFALLRHYEGKTRHDTTPPADQLAASLEFRAQIQAGDPYFNPNLSCASYIPCTTDKDEMSAVEQLDLHLREIGLPSLPISRQSA